MNALADRKVHATMDEDQLDRTPKVLVVDDDAVTRRATSRVLGRADYQVVEAKSGEEGLRLARTEEPDLVILDVVLPDGDGVELCQQIKDDEALDDVYVMLLSGKRTGSESQAAGLEAGADDYVTRPVSNRELLARVRTMLRLKQTEDELRREVAERKRAEKALQERLKELGCLYAVYRDMEADYPVDQLCQRIVDHLPPAMQFPEVAGAAVEVDDRRFTTEGYDEGLTCQLLADVGLDGQTRGRLMVAYSQERPFLIPEEQEMIDAVAESLSLWLERKEAAEEVRFQARLLDAIDQAVVVTDPEGLVIYWNRAAEKLHDWRSGECGASYLSELNPLDGELSIKEIQARLRSGESRSGQVLLERRDGTAFPAILSHTAVRDEDGSLVAIISVSTDITELKQAEEAVKASERKYRQLVENINDAVFSVDAEGVITYVSPVIEEIGGYSPSEVIGRCFYDFVHPEDLPGLQESFYSTLAGDLEPYEYRVRTKSGDLRWVRTSSRAILEDGQPVGLRGVLRDVTEKKRMAEALQESEKRYRNLVENQGEGIGVVDRNGRLSFANPAAHRILGVPPGSLEGRSLREFIDEEQYAVVREEMGSRRSARETTYEVDITRPDGQERTLLVTGRPRHDEEGRFLGTFAVFRDITERKRMKERLEWQADVNSVIADLANALLGSASIEEVSRLVLRGARYLTESTFGYVGYIDPETGHLVCPTMTTEIWDVCDVKEKTFVFESFGGLWGWVLKHHEPLMTNRPEDDPRSSGTPEGHLPIHRFLSAPALTGDELVGQVALANAERDYTERDLRLVERFANIYAIAIQQLRAEEQLAQYAERLEDMVEERTQELREAQEKLLRQQKLATLGQLAGSINHELRGPLGNIKSGAYFLEMAIDDPDEEVNETLELLQQEVDRAESIVSSLLNFVRTEEPQRESVDLNGLLNDLLDDVDISDRVKVFQEMEPDLPVISADPEQLRRIFRNLITNATEAMPEGGELTIETEAVDSNAVRAVVSDTGGGISEENQEKIFEPLFSTKSDGVGLGLALAQMLVEAHGGRIGVESDEGQGSTFTVRLPLSD